MPDDPLPLAFLPRVLLASIDTYGTTGASAEAGTAEKKENLFHRSLYGLLHKINWPVCPLCSHPWYSHSFFCVLDRDVFCRQPQN